MPRLVLEENKLHPAITRQVSDYQKEIVSAVAAAVAAHRITVVGMAHNPYCSKARNALAQAGITFHYLEYGNYFSQWKQRGALKMWTGWPTFPMVFVDGVLIGGYTDMQRLISGGELK